jgi:hypothetical protein
MSNTRTEAFPVDASAAVAAVDVEMDDIIEPLPKATLDERKVLTLPPSITWRQGLAAGWQGKPALQFYGREFLLGIIICMAQIPESIAFAYLARVRPPVALHAAWVIGGICSAFGGRPGMVCMLPWTHSATKKRRGPS